MEAVKTFLFEKQWKERLLFFWLIWTLEIFAYFFLIIALIADTISIVQFKINSTSTFSGNLETFTCGWQSFNGEQTGFQNSKYSDCNDSECILQYQAGQAWLAFGILAALSGGSYIFGAIRDFFLGEFDKEKPIDYYKNCCVCQSLGFSRLGLYFTTFFEFLMIISYAIGEQCSTKDFWYATNVSNSSITNFVYNGGFAMGLACLSLIFHSFVIIIVVYFSRVYNGQLPKSGTVKEMPVQFQMQSNNGQENQPTKPPLPPPSGEPPKSALFRPANVAPFSGSASTGNSSNNGNTSTTIVNNNNQANDNQTNDNQTNDNASKKTAPKATVPVPPPKPKPKTPPPVPTK